MSTSISATIMEFLNKIFGDEAARNEFLEDGPAFLEKNGLDHLSCADFDDAVVSFFENAEFENDKGGHDLAGNFTNTVAQDGQSDHEAISEHLTKIVHEYGDTYVTNNDNDVVNDASFNGTIISDGDVSFDNDIISASGDGSVAAGGDVDDVVTGDGNVVGDHNQVGDESAFGDGANSGNQSADNGGAISNAGNNSTATGSNDDNSDNRDQSVRNEDSFNDNRDQSTDDDVNVDVEVEDSFNDNSDRSREFDSEINSRVENINDDGTQFTV